MATLPISFVDLQGDPVTSGVIVVGLMTPSVNDGASEAEAFVTKALKEFRWSPDDNILRLEAGRVSVRGFTKLFEDPRRSRPFDAAAGSATEFVDLRPGPNPTLKLVSQPRSGLHVTPRVEGVSGPVIRVMRIQPGEDVDEKALYRAEQDEDALGMLRSSTDDEVWRFMDLDPGTYAVGAMDWAGPLYGYEVVEVGSRVVEMDLVIRARDDRRLTVLITGPDGQAVDRTGFIRFTLERSRGNQKQVARGAGYRNPDESFSVWFPEEKGRFLDPDDDAAQYDLLTSHTTYGQVRTRLRPRQQLVEVTFGDPASILVRLEEVRMSGLVARAVSLEQIKRGQPSPDISSRFFATFSRDGGGVSRIKGMNPGRYRVELLAMEFVDGFLAESRIGCQFVDVRGADTPVSFKVPDLHSLEVAAPDLPEGRVITLTSAEKRPLLTWGQKPKTCKLDANRRCTFNLLAPGTYLVKPEGEVDSVRVTVPCDGLTLN